MRKRESDRRERGGKEGKKNEVIVFAFKEINLIFVMLCLLPRKFRKSRKFTKKNS